MNQPGSEYGDGLRVLVMCADTGPWHETVAPTLAEQLRERPEVTVVKLTEDLRVMGARFGRFLTSNLDPASGGSTPAAAFLYRTLFESSLPRAIGQLVLASLGHRALVQTVKEFAADVVVTEHPMLSAALGQLKMLGRFPLPLISVITDPADLHLWAHPGVDMHLLAWPEAMMEVDRIAGPGKAVTVRPLIDERIVEMPAHTAARASAARMLKLSLKGGRPLVLISGGDHAAGDIAGAVDVVTGHAPAAAVAVSTGFNESLEAELSARLAGFDQVRVLGASDRYGTLVAAADVLIDTTGGTAAQAARLAGCPLITYGTGPAHAREDAEALAQLGLGTWARNRDELIPALAHTLEAGRRERLDISELPQAADVVIATALGR